jgi:hypothetical protein
MVPLVGLTYFVSLPPKEFEPVAVQGKEDVLDRLLKVNVQVRIPGPMAQSVDTFAIAVGLTVSVAPDGVAVGDGTTVGDGLA